MSKLDFRSMREAMVKNQLRANNVSDPAIVTIVEALRREDFVPADKRALAYADAVVPLGGGRALNPPMATARLINDAQLKPGDAVLLIGAATGYAAAVIAQLAGQVVALEEDAALADVARAALSDYANVMTVNGPFTKGWHEGAPYDVIIIDGAVSAPGNEIVEQLAPGGRLLMGLVDNGVTRLARGVRHGDHVGLVAFADVETVILPGFEQPAGFKF